MGLIDNEYVLNEEKLKELKGELDTKNFGKKCHLKQAISYNLFEGTKTLSLRTALRICDTFKITDIREILTKL